MIDEVNSIEGLVKRIIEIASTMQEMNMDGNYDCTIFVNEQSFNVMVWANHFFLDYSVVGDAEVYLDDFDYDIDEMTKAVAATLGEDALAEDGIYIWEKDYCEAESEKYVNSYSLTI